MANWPKTTAPKTTAPKTTAPKAAEPKFRVLDEKGNKILVAKIDSKKHKHLSGREFTKDEV